jgi:3-phosphoshikimate 1-carboxyvinyltransferase
MNVRVPHNYKVADLAVPASKSYAQRAILAAALAKGESTIYNSGSSQDVLHIINIAKQLGADVAQTGDVLKIRGHVNPIKKDLNCGESGLGIRLTTPIAAVLGDSFVITGTGSLLKRPMNAFEDFLPSLGTNCSMSKGMLPIEIQGKLRGGEVKIDGGLSSQFLSGLLMALPLAEKNSVVEVENLKSVPYLRMTLEVLEHFGINLIRENTLFTVPRNQKYQASEYYVEGDWSAASYWIVYGALRGINISGLKYDSIQADEAMLKVLERCGVTYSWQDDILKIDPSMIRAFNFDATHCPDLFPALVVLAAAANGKSKIKGLSRLKHKESNRGAVLQKEFQKLGLKIMLVDDEMVIEGEGKLNSGTIDSNNDHRIAMAGAIAALLTDESLNIENAEAVRKSYQRFWEEIG